MDAETLRHLKTSTLRNIEDTAHRRGDSAVAAQIQHILTGRLRTERLAALEAAAVPEVLTDWQKLVQAVMGV